MTVPGLPTEFHLYVHWAGSGDSAAGSAKIDEVLATVQDIQTKGDALMATVADLVQRVTDQKAVSDSIVALVDGLAAQLGQVAQQLRDQGIDPAQLDQLVSDLDAQKAELSDAVTRNTPEVPAPTPTPEPTPTPTPEPTPAPTDQPPTDQPPVEGTVTPA